MNQTDLQKLLAQALDGDGNAHSMLTALIVRNDSCIWQSVVNAAAISTLEAVELAKLPAVISESDCIGLAPYIRICRSEMVHRRIKDRFKEFLCSL